MSFSLNTLKQNYQYKYESSASNNNIHEYFNMGCINEYSSNNTQPIPIKFNQTKQFNIVDKADDYFLSIIRWNLKSNLPVLIPDIQIKNTKVPFSNLTDYELSLVYNSTSTVLDENTYGILGTRGSNFNGTYLNGYVIDAVMFLNFAPANSNNVSYDNVINGILPNGQGSVYIINNGLLKIFDKVSSTNIFTLTPTAGSFIYNFITVDKTSGDFYIGVVYTNEVVEYQQYLRTGPTTWNIGAVYYSNSNIENIAGIASVGSVLYEFNTLISPPDYLYGLQGNNIFEIQGEAQLTSGINIISGLYYGNYNSIPLGYCIDSNFHTYSISYPFDSTQTPILINNYLQISCLYTDQALGYLYSVSKTNQYLTMNLDVYPGYTGSTTNNYSEVGIVTLPNSANPISTDYDQVTKLVLAVGSDNNLYQSRRSVVPYEILMMRSQTATSNLFQQVGFTQQQNGVQFGLKLRDTFPFINQQITGIFKAGVSYYVASFNGNLYDFNQYNIQDGMITNNYPNFDSEIYGLIYLPTSNNFIYSKKNKIIIRSVANPNTIVATLDLPSPLIIPNVFCELDASHFCCCVQGSPNMYIYEFNTPAAPVNTIPTDASKIVDITCNTSDIVNGASTLFYIIQTNSNPLPSGDQVYKMHFTDNTYTATANYSMVYQEPSGRNCTYIECQPASGTVLLLDSVYNGDTGFWNDRQLITFYVSINYASASAAISTYPYVETQPLTSYPYKTNLGLMLLNHSNASVCEWTAITSNISLISASVSQTVPNLIYGINLADNRLYSGTIIGGDSITFTKLSQFKSTYSEISNKASGAISGFGTNKINKWISNGNPTSSVTINQSQTISSNIRPASFITDGTSLYTLYSNLNNQTLMTICDLDMNSPQNTIVNATNNGLIGFDQNNYILISTESNGNFQISTYDQLIQLNISDDPLYVDYNQTSMCIYPFTSYSTITGFTAASEVINLVFIPETINTNLSSILNYPTNKEELFSNSYFYIKYVDTFCRMINIAISTAFKTVPNGSWANLPYFQWDAIEQKIIFYEPTSSPTGTGAPTNAKWYVSVNQPLYNLLSTFRFQYYPKNSGNSQIYPDLLATRYLLDTNILNLTDSTGEYIPYIQQNSSVQTWSPIQSYVFTSTILPIEAQLTGQPQNLNIIDPTTTNNSYKQQSLTKILTDFIVPLTSGVEVTNQILYYIPSGEYRLIDLIGQNSINTLTLEIFWKDVYNVLHPLTLDAGSSSNLLCMLRKKTYNM